jgi:hypothetical protein
MLSKSIAVFCVSSAIVVLSNYLVANGKAPATPYVIVPTLLAAMVALVSVTVATIQAFRIAQNVQNWRDPQNWRDALFTGRPKPRERAGKKDRKD